MCDMRFYFKNLILFFLIFLYITTNNQIFAISTEPDSIYIENLSDKLLLKGFTLNKSTSLKIKNTKTNNTLEIQPNGKTNMGVAFNYKWLGFGIGFGIPFINKDNDIYGKTKRFDFQANAYGSFPDFAHFLS
jgi:hypothetical protein